MSAFIAILDDNPADRKQSERLLSRERDARIPSGEVIYYDSYGSEEALLPHRLRYDLILIDITGSTRDGMMAATDLMHQGIDCQLVLASSKVDYAAKYGSSEGILILKKPLLQKDFKTLVDQAVRHHAIKPPRLELRGEKETAYVLPDEILYARDKGYYTLIALSGNRSFHLADRLSALASQLNDSGFLYTDKKTVINLNAVASYKGNSFKMDDGAVLRFSILRKHAILKAYKALAQRKVKSVL
ncbi:MAG: LytTR family transcriptional regulator DNA-binding domain-containing protein [Lachnospiraceae bacterium]|nr:LytTR family transcriptional regulator DNA-binding domain-containing protein [Lachnospiraceae bacterium]